MLWGCDHWAGHDVIEGTMQEESHLHLAGPILVT